MKRAQLVLLALLLVVVAGIAWLARSNRMPPPLPIDRTHADAAMPDGCLSCHGPSGPNPRPRWHPPSRDCARCHAARAGR